MARVLYPKISPYSQEWLQVDKQHEIYLEQSGNPDGIAVIYFHGGPGAGCSDNYRRYFDPEKYRIILFDQRGCGRSKPSPSIDNNTTWDLVDDIEKIRQHLSIEHWLVTGGSWGTTLALCYGISHPERVLSFVLRGVFLGTDEEYNWLYGPHGAAQFFPEYYRQFISQLPVNQQSKALTGYYQQLTCDNEVAVISASKAWYLWELRLSSIEHHHIDKSAIDDAHQALSMAKISSHYFVNKCYLSPNYILNQIDKIAHIPALILHGRYDMVCLLKFADQLVQKWPSARLQILPCAGHSGFESQTIDAFCKAADTMAVFLDEQT